VLLAETGAILIHFAPAIKLLIGAEGGESVMIDSEWVSKVISYLENLKLEIDERRDDLGEARAFELARHLDELIFQVSQSEGLDFEEAFNYSRYSRAPGSIVTLPPLRDGGLECDCDCAYVVGTQGEVCSDRTCSDKCSDWQSRLWKIAEKYYVGSSAASIKQDLIQRGPLAVSMGIQTKFEGDWDGDIYRCGKDKVCLPPPDNRCTYTNHAVVIVGYNDTGSYWIVRNSWGSGWNGDEKGYFKVGYGECSIESSVYSIDVNRPPVADADGPYVSTEGATVTFDGSGSNDPDRDALQYRWDFDGDGVFDSGWSSSPTSTHSWADQWGGMAKLEVSDGRLTDDDWASVTISNVAPSVSATGDSIVEGGTATVSATFTDPGVQDTHTATVNWGDGSPVEAVAVNQGAGSGSLSATHIYAENGSFTVTVSVTDDDGDTGSGNATVTVSNVVPVVSATGSTIPEGGVATVSATFTDPGVLDTHTAIIDWGDGSPAEAVGVTQGAGFGSLSASHMYGDNGNFTAVVTVTDDDGGPGTGSAMVTVQNVAPTMTLDTSGSIACAGGNVFVGRVGSPQAHQASADDCGSDDLSFSWNFGSATTYFNDGVSPDPFPSPWGLCPFQAADSAEVIFSVPGVHMIEVDITDDDGGLCSASMPKMVTGGCSCSRSQGYWKHQFSLKGKQHLDEAVLQSYLDLVDFASAVFSEMVPATDLTEAYDVLWTKGNSKRDKAYRHALAAWLNVAHGCVEWNEPIDTDNDDVGDTAAFDVLGAIELMLLDGNATHKDLVQAKDLAEAVNLHDVGNPECND
jgi:hypothetical protein